MKAFEVRPRQDRRLFQTESLIFLSPAALLLFMLYLVPVIYSFYIGFTNLQLIGPNAVNYWFTGTANLQRMLADKEFYRSLVLTGIFVFSGAIGATVGGLILAGLVQTGNVVLSALVGAAALIVCVIPPVAVAVMWRASTTPEGVIPVLLGMPGLDMIYGYPMTTVAIANVWWLCGLAMPIFNGALRNIPGEIIEAAVLERASSYQRVTRIILPMLTPTIINSLILMCLMSFGNFALIYLMTGGGPNMSTNILPLYSYTQAFTFRKLGYGALLGNVVVVFAALLGAIFLMAGHYSSRRSTYAGRQDH